MSETDDTEILLLIPPDFFRVQSSGSEPSLLESSRTVVHKPKSCTSQVLGKLVTRVHSLETRLESLELSAASDSISSQETPFFENNTWDHSQNKCNYNSDKKFYTFPRRRKRKLVRRIPKKELSFNSRESNSSCSREIPQLLLKDVCCKSDLKPLDDIINDSQSMDADLSSIVSTPSKKNDKLLLHEIDEFLHKVESYESPESRYNATAPTLSPENVILATCDYMTQKHDVEHTRGQSNQASGNAKSSTVLDKYIYLVRSNASSTRLDDKKEPNEEKIETLPKQSTLLKETSNFRQSNETPTQSAINSNMAASQAKSPSVRRLNYTDVHKDYQPTSTPKKYEQRDKVTSYLDSFRPSTNKIYDRATQVLDHYKKSYSTNIDSTVDTNLLHSSKTNDYKVPQSRLFASENRAAADEGKSAGKFIDSVDTELLSLSNLWGPKGDQQDSTKLREERLKREHCESMIQELQKKLLEQQQMLAVAVKVDCAKDNAISKLREAWLKVTNSMERSEARYKASLDKMATNMEHYKTVANDAQKKIEHYEAELYKALDLAHDYQDKCKRHCKEQTEAADLATKLLSDKDDIIKSKTVEYDNLKENYDTLMTMNKQSSECVRSLENAVEKEKLDHMSTVAKLQEISRKIENIQDETKLVIEERDLLKEKVNEERARYSMLEKQFTERKCLISAMEKREDALSDEILSLQKQLDLQKNELKCHYQKQLEDAVLSKLQEFQHQLEHAEREMENEARLKESTIMETYNKQLARIEDQHKLEIKVMEEKQKEEVKLYRLQLAQANEKLVLLESKLDTHRRRRSQLASQLHSVMESQWRQALHILTTPTPAPGLRPQSYSHSADNTAASTPIAHDYAPSKIPPLTMPALAQKGLGRQHDEGRHLTPDMFNFEGLSDNELQQYVKLLLNKPPILDGSGDSCQVPCKEADEEPTSDRGDPSQDRGRDKPRRSLNKPPWKS